MFSFSFGTYGTQLGGKYMQPMVTDIPTFQGLYHQRRELQRQCKKSLTLDENNGTAGEEVEEGVHCSVGWGRGVKLHR